jgi:hypothetical protein
VTHEEELKMPATDIDWSMRSPCDQCPFLKTSPYHSGVAGSLPAYMESIQNQCFAHTCHKTDNRPSVDGPKNYGGKVKHCAGAILMLLKTGKAMDLQLPLLEAAERGDLDLHAMSELAKHSPQVFTVWELIRWYGKKVRERLKKKKDELRKRIGR